MRLTRVAVLLVGVLGISGCVDNNTIEAQTTPTKDPAAFKMAKRLVSDRMRDPEATRFKPNYKAYRTKNGDFIVCGTLNAKNAMGGYVGYKPFYVRIRNGAIEALQLPSEGDHYGLAVTKVQQACSEAANGRIMVSS
jgi:hypothetical protein